MPVQLKLRLERPARVPTYKDTAIVTPNGDTPCSLLWMDLGAEADGVSLPAEEPKRYYLASRTH